MTQAGGPPRLSGDEVARVLRRAAEIDAVEARTEVGLDPAALEEAAQEVGLSPAAVRRAVAELRAGALPAAPTGRRRAERAAGGSRRVCEQRLVDRPVGEVRATVDRFMRSQMLELRRSSGDRSLYRHRADMVAGLRRALDFGGAIKLEGLTLVDVVVTPADDHTLVRIEAEMATSRTRVVAEGAAVGGFVTVLTGAVGALLAEPALLVAAVPAGAAVGGGGIRVGGSRWQRRRDDLAEVIAHLLDRL